MAIEEHGGSYGIRDRNMLESALARPQNKYAYAECDLFDLAAAYGFGLAKNHPFVDGNKRTAAITCFVFLELNGFSRAIPEAEVAAMFEDLAAGEVDEDGLAAWLRERLTP
jgi:death-on-curing protein